MIFDRNRLTIKKLDERKSKTSYNPMGIIPELKTKEQLVFIDELADEIKKKKKVVIGFGVIVLIPFYFIDIKIGNIIKVDKIFFLILAYVILFPGILSFIFWIKGVALIGANRAGVYLNLMPILGAIMAMIIFGEKFMFYHFLGAIFILSGIILSNRKKISLSLF